MTTRKTHTPEQIVAKLRYADVMSNADKELLLELQSNRNLRCLSLTKCLMQSSTQELFSSFVQLKKLRLLHCGIPDETIRGIGQALNTCEVVPRVP